MTRNGKYIFAAVAAATLGLATVGAVAYHRGGDWGHRGHGWRQHSGLMGLGGFGGPFGRFCRGDSAEIADHLLVRIEHKVKPTDAQKSAFDELKTATRAAAEKMRAGCPKTTDGDPAENEPRQALTPLERLDRAEAQLAASIEAIKTVRPAAEKFYAALSDDQKAKLSEWRGRPHWKHRARGSDERNPAPQDAETPPPSQE